MTIKSFTNLTDEFLGNPVLAFQTELYPGFNTALGNIVTKEINKFIEKNGYDDLTKPFLGASGFSGYKRINILEWRFKESAELRKLFLEGFKIYLNEFKAQYGGSFPEFITCWPNLITNYGGQLCPHFHDPNPFNISGVYYAAGDFKGGLVTTNFWPGNKGNKIEKIFRPSLGSLIMFPANLTHSARAYPSSLPRISLAFDIFFKGSPKPLFCKFTY